MNGFAPHRLPQPEGNMNGWLMEDKEELERNEVDSDLESTASSKPVWMKTTKADPDRASLNHVFEIDLMPIELGTFDVIIGMDWLVKHDAVIVCGEKVVRIPYGNKMLIVESDKSVSLLKVISCIKAPAEANLGYYFKVQQS
ncbi:putative reverse transcriptase domain-containing protein [Tanacetum coccineum]